MNHPRACQRPALARTSYLREVDALRAAGADAVFSGEGEVALAMTEAVLRALGATTIKSIASVSGSMRTCLVPGH